MKTPEEILQEKITSYAPPQYWKFSFEEVTKAMEIHASQFFTEVQVREAYHCFTGFNSDGFIKKLKEQSKQQPE